MKILMLYPKFTMRAYWELDQSNSIFYNRVGGTPPLGFLSLAAELPDDFDLRLIDRNICNETEEDWNWADIVFLSLMSIQVEDYRTCITNAQKYNKPVAVGGPFTHAFPETAVADADWVCFGEIESIVDEFIDDIRADKRGKQYHGGNGTNMEKVKPPRFDLLKNVNDYVLMTIQFSRGCPYNCEFCDIIEIYGRIPRTKKPHQLLTELTILKNLGYKGDIFLMDDNFFGNRKSVKSFLRELAVWNRDNGYPFEFCTEASINMGDDEEFLKLMSEANFFFVFIGIETPDPEILKSTQKLQNTSGNILERINRIRKHGLYITAGFMIGFDDENRVIFDIQKSFIQESGIGIAMLNLLTAIPNTQFSRRLEAEGRTLKNITVDPIRLSQFPTGINFVPKGELTKREYLNGFVNVLKELYDPKAFFARILHGQSNLQNKRPIKSQLNTLLTQLPILLRIIHYFGVVDRSTRLHFWNAFLRLIWRNPKALKTFCYDCYLYLHIKQLTEYVNDNIPLYLSNPSKGDILDEVITVSESQKKAVSA